MASSYDPETYRAPMSHVPSISKCPIQWPLFVQEVKLLYYKHNYRRCVCQCEMMLQDKSQRLRPIQETFLYFFVAICNESLGLTAHKFSPKKLSFLHLAKDAFIAASASLPLPPEWIRLTDDTASSKAAHSLFMDKIGTQDEGESNAFQQSKPACLLSSNHFHPTFTTKRSLDERRDSGYDSQPDSLPAGSENIADFSSYSAYQPRTALIAHDLPGAKSSPHAEDPEHQGNLTTNKHLIPKPLFIQKRTADLNGSFDAVRPLPPLPDHPIAFSQRQTTIPPTHTISPLSATAPNPILIPQTYDHGDDDDDDHHDHHHEPPPLSCSQPLFHPDSHSSTALQHQLSKHITYIDQAIIHTTRIQQDHKLSQSKRLASFWSFQPVLPAASETEPDPDVGRDGDGRHEKNQRIARLRSTGWKVTKESHGWKGRDHYEALRAAALADLAC